MQEDKKESVKKPSAHHFLHFYRNRLMNVIVYIAIAVYFVASVSNTVPKELDRCYELLSTNIQQADRYELYSNEANDLYISMQDQDYLSAGQMFISYIQDGEDPESIVNYFNSISDDYDSVFYLYNDGTLVSGSDRPSLDLTKEQLNQLVQEGSLQFEDDSNRYYSLNNDGDHMLIRIDEAYASQFSMDMLNLLSLDGFIYNNDTFDIVEKDDETLPDNYEQMYVGEAIESDSFNVEGATIRLISPYKNGLKRIFNLKLAAVKELNYQNKGYTICTYIPISEIISNILIRSGLPTLLCLAFICISIFGSLHFREVFKQKVKNDGEDQNTKKIKLPFNCYIDTALARHILFMQLFMGLLIIFCSIILLTLSRFSLSYENSKYNLQQLVSTEKTCEESLEGCWDVYKSPAVGMAGSVNAELLKGDVRTDKDVQKFLTDLVNSTFLEEISIYDRDGENIYTTADHVGYPLSDDPDSSQYAFWNLMSGDQEYVLTRSDNDDGLIYCAMKRDDEVGIVVVSFSDQGFSDLETKLSQNSIAANFYYRDSCLFIDKNLDSSDTIANAYQILSDGSKFVTDSPDLPTLSYSQTFCGFRSFNGDSYFIVGLGDSTRSIYYFQPVSEIVDGLSENIISYIVFLIIICLFDFIGCAVYTPETFDTNHKSNATKKNYHVIIDRMKKKIELANGIEDSQKTLWRQGLYSTICLIAFTLIFDLIINENSLINFLFKVQWEKSFSLFSLSSITLVVLGTCLLFAVLNIFFDELIKNLPKKYTTATQMIHSILNILIVVYIIVYSANELGIDTQTIIASIGISGIALGIAAKDTINDMINGIFIILDGRIQVGDYIEVNGFYGYITKIGIRTTKVQYYNMEKSINNSDMNNIQNDSRGSSSVYIKFKVSIDTDIEKLKNILVSSSARFNEACHGLLTSDLFFLGVSAFDADNMTIAICMLTTERYRKRNTRACNAVLIQILKENNIQIGSSLIVETENGRDVRFISTKKQKKKSTKKSSSK